jgi:hypothetical protein
MPQTPQQRAEQAAELGRQLMNARKPKTAIQTCVLSNLEPVAEDALFEQGHKKDANGIWEWPTPVASAYMAMIEAVEAMDDADFTTKGTDKQKLMDFLTEQLGLEGCKQVLRERLKENIPDSQFEVFHGPGVTNIVLVHPPPPDPTGKTYVGEAKGGSSQPKDDQGTIKDLRGIAKKMSKSNLKSRKSLPGESAADQKKRVDDERARRRDVGDALLLALDDKTNPVTIVTVQTPSDPKKQPEVIKESKTRP